MFDLKLTDSEKAEFQEAARLCGTWILNGQNLPTRPWGATNPKDSADRGRFVEKTHPARDYRRATGVWLSGIYLSSLIDLQKAPILDKALCHTGINEGARFLKSLQCFDGRWEKAVGGFHECYPGHNYSAPRDAASGCCGLISLYLHTEEEEYLDRAIRFANWYSTFGSDEDGFPWDDYDLEKGEGTSTKRGDWQAGGALVYFQLYKLTGDERWKEALRKALDVLVQIHEDGPQGDTAYTFHGNCVISIGNDDFANTALFAGYEVLKNEGYLEVVRERLRAELARQDERGAFPGYGGTYVTALELLEALDISADRGVEILPEEELVGPLLTAARFGLTQQDKTNPDRYMLGGIYGQSNYAHAKDVVHGRDVVYCLQLWLRLAGHRASIYTTLGWEK